MKHVIITGGSSGIGFALARLYVERGWRVSLIARRATLLNEAVLELQRLSNEHAGRVHGESADVSDEAELHQAVERCEAAFGPCDLLVTSAGQVEPALFLETSSAQFNAQVSTNLLGTANAIRTVYRGMVARGRGQIMVVSSAAAWIGIHGYSAYCASKSALIGFVEALRAEAKANGITVSICFPPDTLTPQYQAELPKRSGAAKALMGGQKPWPVEAVASRILCAADQRKDTVHFGFQLTMLSYFGPLLKPILYWWADKQLMKEAR